MSPRVPITRFTSRYVILQGDNVDTDQIIPARFLKTTQRTGLGPHAFHDWRNTRDGLPKPDFPLNRPEAAGAEILVGGNNFGCGSSREHAVWALLDAGFRAVVSTRFADIFRANALANGLLPIEVKPVVHGELLESAGKLTVDLSSGTLARGQNVLATFSIPPFSRHCLLNGIDELDFLLSAATDIDAFERGHPPRVSTLA